jgi:exodeoxyribonuclease VII large subunit
MCPVGAELFPETLVRELSLVRLAGEIARCTGGIGRVAVVGEVVRPRRLPGGRTYFTLRDRVAQVSVVCPAANISRCRVVDGERAQVTGSLQWIVDRGQLELAAEEVSPVGAGAIAAAIAERRERLAAAGLLDRPRKDLPLLPRGIGVICGAEAAVRADIESVAEHRFPGYPLFFLETTVSGPGAAGALLEALRHMDGFPQIEVILLARGGGDAASMLAFSDEELCRAVAFARAVVVSAVGHQADRPLCDEVADHRFGTPSIAAAAVIPERAALVSLIDDPLRGAALVILQRRQRAEEILERLLPLERAWALMDGAARRLADARQRIRPELLVAQGLKARQALSGLDWRRPAGELLRRRGEELAASEQLLVALDPQKVLERGYAVVRGAAGNVLRDPTQVSFGEILTVRLAKGELTASVEKEVAR